MKTTGLIAIVFGYHKKSQQTLGLSTGNFVKKKLEYRDIGSGDRNRNGGKFYIGSEIESAIFLGSAHP